MNRCHFDKEAFSKLLKLKALRVPLRQCSFVRDKLSSFLLSIRRVKPIQLDSSTSSRLILLSESLEAPFPSPVASLIQQEGYQVVDYELEVGYSQLSAMEVMQQLLPEGVIIPSSFETVGHIAHVNLRPEHELFKYQIGAVLLDKNPSIATVVNKTRSVENEFRVLEWELLAGEANLETEVKREGLRFCLDFGKVYWNSRLESEHKRLVHKFQPGEIVVDLMAGIGPFAIPAAKKGCLVYANDKNPFSFKYLVQNIKCNKVVGGVIPSNLDARFCMKVLLGMEDSTTAASEGVVLPQGVTHFDHVVMNYPQYAIEFLDMFKGVFDREVWLEEEERLPIIHCYTFMKEDEDENDLCQKCANVMGSEIPLEEVEFHIVRNVAPSKVMCCMSFRLPGAIAFKTQYSNSRPTHEDNRESPKLVKRQKCNETDE